MKLKPLALAAALAAALFALPAAAQQDTLLAGISPARVRAAERVLVAMRAEELLTKGMEPTIQAMFEQQPDMREFEDIFREFFAEALAWDEMRPEMIRLYAEVYTEEEMDAMAAFYETPIGQRLVAKMPEVMARSTMLNQERVQARMPELIGRIMARMSEAEPDTPARP